MIRRRLILLAATIAVFAVTVTPSSATDQFAQEFLSEFGYLPYSQNSASQSTPEMLSEAIIEYQTFMKLTPTGILDSETIEMMQAPRCGIPDKEWGSNRYKRGIPTGTKWPFTDLTYKVSQYGSLLTREETDRALQAAFDVWAEVTPLTFTKRTGGSVTFDIRFERGNHTSYCNPFDGRGRVLAHAFFPPAANAKKTFHGNTHFDDAELWTMGSQGVNLFQVAVHEIGHAIGLRHSDVHGAVMFPIYRYQADFKLQKDDIDTIQMVYGKPNQLNKKTSGRCMCICEGNKMRFFDKDPGIFSGNIVDDGQESSHYDFMVDETQQSPYNEPAVIETQQSPYHEPAEVEIPQSPYHEPAEVEIPQSPYYEPAIEEIPQSPYHEPAVVETPQSPDHEPVANEIPESPYYDPTVNETPQSPDYETPVDETLQQSPYYETGVDETLQQSPLYDTAVDETLL